MGGKGRRRREKNYRAAHGGSHSLLPPPPKSSQVDALPSKLRKLISLTSQLHDEHAKNSMSGQENTKQQVGDAKKKRAHEEGNKATMVKDEGVEEIVEGSGDEKRKKKKKKRQVNDLRFEMGLHKSKTVEKRRERKKKYLEAKKKKNKKSEERQDFPGREQIQFGDVVQAPPKLTAPSKLLKNVHEASRERLRLQAIEAYRGRRGWTSRPGLHLPPPVTTTTSLQ
ncbi:PREDICTED: protein PXR1 [Populus euphratica]|uniref:Protein PXR1 n=1 Tax=Populus euphratica TaxID=75702 RepID=A0AAJ6UST2_POPEU|nr:PREDICTED: protein PXR1 [Populus euphratica]